MNLPSHTGVAVVLLIVLTWATSAAADSMLAVDHQKLVARADLTYERPVIRSEEGLPLGNGRMGSLVWTTPSTLKLQINRVDVFASNSATDSFPERHTDYCGGCGFVDVDCVDYGNDVFPGDGTRQHLSCYDGLVSVQGKGVRARALAWHEQDIIAVEITDLRSQPTPINVRLRTLRPTRVKTRNHSAVSRLSVHGSAIGLTQEFEEGDYYCSSVAVVRIAGRNAQVRRTHDQELRLSAEPGRGSFTILIASAATFDRKEDLAASALSQVEAAAARGYSGLVESNRKWWSGFWSKSFVHLHSADGVADFVERNYTYYLYVMASSSRGRFPVKFNGMLWTTGGDVRKWGAQYWGANQSCLYNALFAANRIGLVEPMFRKYSGMCDRCGLAARQQWGSRGIYIPETTTFDGPAEMPPEIAEEMRDLYLARKPWSSRSDRFSVYASTKQPHNSRWNWKQSGRWNEGRWNFTDKGAGPYAHVNHLFSRGAKVAYQYWLRYEYTQDEQWLRDQAYPVLKGVAEFYRNYPNVKKGADGKYHIHNVNSNEPLWGGQDTDEEISAMRGVLPCTIRASEILEVDAAMRPVWREFLDNLAQFPRRQDGAPVWVKAVGPVVRGRAESPPDRNTMPMWCFDLCTLENTDPGIGETANATFASFFREGVNAKTRIGVLSKLGVAAAVLGRADDVRFLVPNQIRTRETPVLANRMTLREGAQTTGLQRIGRAADALHFALYQSVPAGPGQPPVIRVFPAWPRQWDAAYRLLARGAFLVGSSMKNGRIEFVEITSQVGGKCRLRNPWPGRTVTLYRNGEKAKDLSGALLLLPTARNETLVIVPSGTSPTRRKVL